MSTESTAGTETDEAWPLLDPDRELCGLPGSCGPSGPVLTRAYEQVRGRLPERGLWKAEDTPDGGREPLRVLPALAALHPRAEPVLRERVETVVRCLQHLVRRYRVDPELADFLGVPPVLRRWVREEPEPGGLCVDLCRLDLLGDRLDTVRVLEFNASCPGGVLSSGAVSTLWRETALGGLLAEWEVPAAPFESATWFAEWLVAYGARRGLTAAETRRVGLFRPPHGTTFEFGLLAAQFAALGRETVELDPADPEAAAGVRLGHLKYIPVDTRPVTGWDTFLGRVQSRDGDRLVLPNVPGERWVAENKLCLAALSDPRFRHLFSARERAALDALVPYGRKLGDGLTPDEAVAARDRLVLKAPYSCRGRSVLIGADTAPDAWAAAVRSPERRGWLLQEQVRAEAVRTAEGPYFRDLVVPVLDGRVIGYGSRMSHGHLLNAARGGGTTALYAPYPLGEPDTSHRAGV